MSAIADIQIYKPYPPFNWNNGSRGDYCSGIEGKSLVQLGTYMNNTDGYGFRQEPDDEKRTVLDRECGIDGYSTYPDIGEVTSQIKGLKNNFYIIIETELEWKGPGKTGWLYTTQAERMQFEGVDAIYDCSTEDFRHWAIPLQDHEVVTEKTAAQGTFKTYKRPVYDVNSRADSMFYVSYKKFIKDMGDKMIVMPKLLDRSLQIIV